MSLATSFLCIIYQCKAALELSKWEIVTAFAHILEYVKLSDKTQS